MWSVFFCDAKIAFFFCKVGGKCLNVIWTRYTTKQLLPLQKKYTFLHVIGSYGLGNDKEKPIGAQSMPVYLCGIHVFVWTSLYTCTCIHLGRCWAVYSTRRWGGALWTGSTKLHAAFGSAWEGRSPRRWFLLYDFCFNFYRPKRSVYERLLPIRNSFLKFLKKKKMLLATWNEHVPEYIKYIEILVRTFADINQYVD